MFTKVPGEQTDLYTLMCYKATEIQARHIPKHGDVVCVKWLDNVNRGGLQDTIVMDRPAYGISYNFTHDRDNKPEKWYSYNGNAGGEPLCEMVECVVWQPSVEQLIAMLDISMLEFLEYVQGFAMAYLLKDYLDKTNFQILTLMYVMYHNYDKLWNGEDWEQIEVSNDKGMCEM